MPARKRQDNCAEFKHVFIYRARSLLDVPICVTIYFEAIAKYLARNRSFNWFSWFLFMEFCQVILSEIDLYYSEKSI